MATQFIKTDICSTVNNNGGNDNDIQDDHGIISNTGRNECFFFLLNYDTKESFRGRPYYASLHGMAKLEIDGKSKDRETETMAVTEIEIEIDIQVHIEIETDKD